MRSGLENSERSNLLVMQSHSSRNARGFQIACTMGNKAFSVFVLMAGMPHIERDEEEKDVTQT